MEEQLFLDGLQEGYYGRAQTQPLDGEGQVALLETLAHIDANQSAVSLFSQDAYAAPLSRYVRPAKYVEEVGLERALQSSFYIWPRDRADALQSAGSARGRLTVTCRSGDAETLAKALAEIIDEGEFGSVMDHAKIMAPALQGFVNESAVVYFNCATPAAAQTFHTRLVARMGTDGFAGQPTPAGLAPLGDGFAYGEISAGTNDPRTHGSFFSSRQSILLNVFRHVKVLASQGVAPSEQIWRSVLASELQRNGYSGDDPAFLLRAESAAGSSG